MVEPETELKTVGAFVVALPQVAVSDSFKGWSIPRIALYEFVLVFCNVNLERDSIDSIIAVVDTRYRPSVVVYVTAVAPSLQGLNLLRDERIDLISSTNRIFGCAKVPAKGSDCIGGPTKDVRFLFRKPKHLLVPGERELW